MAFASDIIGLEGCDLLDLRLREEEAGLGVAVGDLEALIRVVGDDVEADCVADVSVDVGVDVVAVGGGVGGLLRVVLPVLLL